MRQLQEASDGASFAGLSAGILWMPFGPDGILWTTVRIGSLVVTARPLATSDVRLAGERTSALVASSDAQNAFSTGIGANPHGRLPARETSVAALGKSRRSFRLVNCRVQTAQSSQARGSRYETDLYVWCPADAVKARNARGMNGSSGS
jgi:hypothetical protein